MTGSTDSPGDDLFAGLRPEEPSRETERRIFARAAVELSRRKRKQNRIGLAAVGLAAGFVLAASLFVIDRDVAFFFGKNGSGVVVGKDRDGLFMEKNDSGRVQVRSWPAEMEAGSEVAQKPTQPLGIVASGSQHGNVTAVHVALSELRADVEAIDEMTGLLDEKLAEDGGESRRNSIVRRLRACMQDLDHLERFGKPRLPREDR